MYLVDYRRCVRKQTSYSHVTVRRLFGFRWSMSGPLLLIETLNFYEMWLPELEAIINIFIKALSMR